jgi:hypothetical protein
MEAQAVVDAPYVALPVDEAVTALAVSVVGDHVEGGHAAQVVAVLGRLQEGEVVLVEKGIHTVLEGPGAERPVGASRGGWHDAPAQEGAQLISGHLTLPQPAGEVPERPFTSGRFVNGEHGLPVPTPVIRATALGLPPSRSPRRRANGYQERGVGAPREPPPQLDLAVGQGG